MPLNLATSLTLFRALACVVLLALFFVPDYAARWAAVVVFALACLSDWLDGMVARAWNQSTAFGRMLDPIADKLLVLTGIGLMIADGEIRDLSLVPAFVIVWREVFVSGLREHLGAQAEPVVVHVSFLAKAKTSLQMVALLLLFVAVAGPFDLPFGPFGVTLLWVAAAVTLVTGWQYARQGLAALDRGDAAR